MIGCVYVILNIEGYANKRQKAIVRERQLSAKAPVWSALDYRGAFWRLPLMKVKILSSKEDLDIMEICRKNSNSVETVEGEGTKFALSIAMTP